MGLGARAGEQRNRTHTRARPRSRECGPRLVTSRLLCPRRLEPLTRYTAYVVPAFERGRLSGLRLPVPDSVDGLAARLDRRRCRRDAADFLSVALPHGGRGRFRGARAPPRAAFAAAGSWHPPMDVSDPRGALAGVPANDTPLGLEGALKTTRTPDAGTTPTKTRFVDRLRALLNCAVRPTARSANPTRAVAPPLYGRWHAAQETLEPGTRPVWFHELNQDPRMRVTSGLGTQVVQSKQRELMAGAWQQVEGIRAANEERGRAAARALEALYDRHFKVAFDESVIALTTKLHAKVRAARLRSGRCCVRARYRRASWTRQFRRVARPRARCSGRRSALGRRQGRRAVTTARREPVRPAEPRGHQPGAPPPVPADLPTIGGRVATAATPLHEENLPAWLTRGRILLFLILALVLLVVGRCQLRCGRRLCRGAPRAVPRARFSRRCATTSRASRAAAISGRTMKEIGKEQFTRELMVPARPTSRFSCKRAAARTPARSPTHARRPARTTIVPMRDSSGRRGGIQWPTWAAPVAPPLRMVMPASGTKLETAVNPRVTIATALRTVVFATDLVWEPADPLDDHALPEVPSTDVRIAARSRTGLAAARARADRGEHSRAGDHQSAHDRVVHGGSQSRDVPRAALE